MTNNKQRTKVSFNTRKRNIILHQLQALIFQYGRNLPSDVLISKEFYNHLVKLKSKLEIEQESYSMSLKMAATCEHLYEFYFI